MWRLVPLLCLTCKVFCGVAAGQQHVPVVFSIDNTASEVTFGLSIPGSRDSDASPVSGTLAATLQINTSGGAADITGLAFTGGEFRNDEPYNLSLTVLGFLRADLEGTDLIGSPSTPEPPSPVTRMPGNGLRFQYDAADHVLTLHDGMLTAEGAFEESVDLSQEPLSGVPPVGSIATIELVPLGMIGSMAEFAATLSQPTIFSDTYDVDAGLFDVPVTVNVSGQVRATGNFVVDLGGGGPTVPGDYNGNGLVEQADLDLVLAHWGAGTEEVGESWVSEPPQGVVDQGELDGVLANWGRTAAPLQNAAARVPEPSAAALWLMGMICALRSRRVRALVRSLSGRLATL